MLMITALARRPPRASRLLQRRQRKRRRLVGRRRRRGGLPVEAEHGLPQVEQVGLAVLLVAGGVHDKVEAARTGGCNWILIRKITPLIFCLGDLFPSIMQQV